MSKEYAHKAIEKKWQKIWEKTRLYRVTEDKKKPKAYVLDMFPYPSGEGLHVGHPKGYIASDVYGRMKRLQGFNVLHPMGWDAFGLPAENYAIANKVHPSKAVAKNVARFKEQLQKIGFTFDWSREIDTTDPEFYRWTQWIFLQLYKKGLAYESFEPINWCPKDQTGLANEDVENGRCERCGTPIVKKPMRQWVLKITAYADRMLEDLPKLSWPASILESQRNWIGRSEGAEITFPLRMIPGQKDDKHGVKVFTTRPDTLFGATFLAISPELAKSWADLGWKASRKAEVFIAEELSRRNDEKYLGETEKRGVDAGIVAVNPATKKEIPVWIVNYVLGDVGTGAIMAVPAHDERDFAFAKKYSLPIIEVVKGGGVATSPYTGDGELINSLIFSGMYNEKAKWEIAATVGGKRMTTYKLKDWVFSRQRYWGEPIPVVHDETGKPYPVHESDLPVLLPNVKSYAPSGTGESPLATIGKWVKVKGYITKTGMFKAVTAKHKAPKGTKVKTFTRETNTMPQWAGSSWYYLRYIDPKNRKALVDPKKERYWMPVDLYVGGAEHATRHLIYARFWHKVLYDIGAVSSDEPFMRLQHVGLINASDGRKMSKRYGNVVNPDDVIALYGADTLRVYEMFMGPFDQAIAWSTENMIGARRFIERVWRLAERVKAKGALSDEGVQLLHASIKKVGEDIEHFNFNTAISQMMILLNRLEKEAELPASAYETLLILLSPFAPHVTEELWNARKKTSSIHLAKWPTFDPAKLVKSTVTIGVQVAGKMRGSIELSVTATQEEALALARKDEAIEKWLGGKAPARVIYVKGKILNLLPDSTN